LREYPGFIKVNFSAVQQITPTITAVIRVDNLFNQHKSEFDNLRPAQGRLSMMGLRLTH
jgi:hypothetical protein